MTRVEACLGLRPGSLHRSSDRSGVTVTDRLNPASDDRIIPATGKGDFRAPERGYFSAFSFPFSTVVFVGGRETSRGAR